VVTWSANSDRQGAGPVDRSYRMIVRTSVGGTDMRIRLTNTFGDHPVTFASVYTGLQKQGAELVHGSNRQLAFGGRPSITVPAGETVLSDPLPTAVVPCRGGGGGGVADCHLVGCGGAAGAGGGQAEAEAGRGVSGSAGRSGVGGGDRPAL